MHDLVYQLKTIARHNKDGSFATQSNRQDMLMLFGTQLIELGYKQLTVYDLKGRHVNKLLALWRAQGIADATIRNRLSVLRWLMEKLGKRGVMYERNSQYGLRPRETVTRTSKAKALPANQVERITDPYLRFSLALQRHFGLRREESMKIRLGQADQ